MIDSLRLAVAMAPLAIYGIVLGLIRFRRYPTVLSSALDMLLLGLGTLGLIAIGPMELFFPRAAFALLGNWVWVLLIGLYLFAILLVALGIPPKLIFYGLEASELKEQVKTILDHHEIHSQWLDDILVIPEMGVRASIENAGRFRVSQLSCIGRPSDISGWLALERLMVSEIKPVARNSFLHGCALLLAGVLLLCVSAISLYSDRVRLHEIVSTMYDE